MLVKELKEKGELPKEFLEVLPETCEDCGFPLGISPSLTGLSCENPYCISKLTERTKSMFDVLGIVGIGTSGIMKGFQERKEFKSPLDWLLLGNDESGLVHSGESGILFQKLVQQLEPILDKGFFLWEVFQIAQLPNIQGSARTILNGYSDVGFFYEDLENGGIDFIKEKLNISDGADIRAGKIYESFLTYKDDFLRVVPELEINFPAVRKTIDICISGGLNGYSNKKKYVEELNEKFSQYYTFYNTGSLSSTVRFLINDGGRETSKVVSAKKKGIPIFTSEGFLNYVENNDL